MHSGFGQNRFASSQSHPSVSPPSFHNLDLNMSAGKNVIITGAGGMIGPMLAQRLHEDGYNLILTDIVEPKAPKGGNAENVKCLKGDITDAAFVKKLLDAAQPLHAIFIFHGIMSAGSEANFDLVSTM